MLVLWVIESESKVLAGVHLLNDLFTRSRVRTNDLFEPLYHLFNVFLLVLSGHWIDLHKGLGRNRPSRESGE